MKRFSLIFAILLPVTGRTEATPVNTAAPVNTATPVKAVAPEIAVKAQDVLSNVAEYYSSLPACRFSLRLESSLSSGENTQNSAMTYLIALHKPNRFRMDMMMDEQMATVISDGKTLFRYVPQAASYTKGDAPEDLNIEAMFQQDNSGIGSFLAALFSDSPYTKLIKGVTKVDYEGQETINGTECHKLKFYQEIFDWTMWVQMGPQPFVKRISPDMARVMKKAAERSPAFKDSVMLIVGTFDDWKSSKGFKPGKFSFTPPPLVKLVESFDEVPEPATRPEPESPDTKTPSPTTK